MSSSVADSPPPSASTTQTSSGGGGSGSGVNPNTSASPGSVTSSPANEKDSPLSPNAPVFFPKWKFASSPGAPRRPLTEGENLHEFGRSMSGGFGAGGAGGGGGGGSLRGHQPQPPSATATFSPNSPRRMGRGASSASSTTTNSNPSSPLAQRANIHHRDNQQQQQQQQQQLQQLPQQQQHHQNQQQPMNTSTSRASSWREDATLGSGAHSPAQSQQLHQQQQQQQQGLGLEGEGKGSSKAITVEHRMIKPGAYSTWIRVLSADVGPAQLAAVLARCEESNSKGTIHVYLREKFLNRQLIQQLKSQGYKFHHFVEETQTFVYGKRPSDSNLLDEGRELLNATAKELIGVLVISPDEKQVLLVWEAGKWSCLMGNIITRESVIDGVRREVRTQLNLEVDKTSPSLAVGGWSKAAAKFDCINEVLLCFAVKVTSATLDLEEDMHAQWFSIDELIQLLEMVDEQFKQLGSEPKLDSAIEHPPGNIFSHTSLRWVKSFRTGAAWHTTNVAERYVFCI